MGMSLNFIEAVSGLLGLMIKKMPEPFGRSSFLKALDLIAFQGCFE